MICKFSTKTRLLVAVSQELDFVFVYKKNSKKLPKNKSDKIEFGPYKSACPNPTWNPTLVKSGRPHC